MATVTLNIPDAIAPRVVEANTEGYSATLPDGSANPQTRAQFFKQNLIKILKQNTKEYEARIAAQTAATTASTAADTEITIT